MASWRQMIKSPNINVAFMRMLNEANLILEPIQGRAPILMCTNMTWMEVAVVTATILIKHRVIGIW